MTHGTLLFTEREKGLQRVKEALPKIFDASKLANVEKRL